MSTPSRGARAWRPLAATLALSAAACARSTPPAPAAPVAPLTVSVVATSDLHGHVEALPWLAGHVRVLREARARDGGAVLLVDAGDMFQGTLESNLTEGAAVVRAYNALGYAAAAVGNHEFDYGPEGEAAVPGSPADNPRGALEARAREARFPLLAANVRRSGGAAWTPANVRRSTIVTAAGVRIGIVGVTTRETATATDPRNVAGLDIAPLAETIAAEARALRDAGAAAVLVLAHAGAGCQAFDAPDDLSSCGPRQEIFEVARALPAGLVDAMASGHTHQAVAHRVNGIAVVGSYAEGVAFGRLDLVFDRGRGRPAEVRIFPPRFVCNGRTRQPVTSVAPTACAPANYDGERVAFDRELAAVIAADVVRADAVRSRALGVVLETTFERRGPFESAVGNLVADMIRAARPEADVGIYNRGGLRADLPAGLLTYGRLYTLLPFDNTVATMVMSAGDLGRAVIRGLVRGTAPSFSGLRGEVRCTASGPRIDWWRLDGRPVEPETPLTVATSSFLVADGDGLFEGLTGSRTIEDGSLRDLVAQALTARGGRLRADDPAILDPRRPRLSGLGRSTSLCADTAPGK